MQSATIRDYYVNALGANWKNKFNVEAPKRACPCLPGSDVITRAKVKVMPVGWAIKRLAPFVRLEIPPDDGTFFRFVENGRDQR